MGIGVQVTCKRCGWSRDFALGSGMFCGDVHHTIRFLPHRCRPEVEDILSNHPVDEHESDHVVYVCEQCGALKERFWMRLRYAGDRTFETHYDCHKCRRRMSRIADEEIERQRCPECGLRELKSETTMLWD